MQPENAIADITIETGIHYSASIYLSDVKHCRDDSCDYGNCQETAGHYWCKCEAGYQGDKCDQGKTLHYT